MRALERQGFKVARVAGSHHIMRHSDGRGTTVPVHGNRDIAKGALRGILGDVGMTIEELRFPSPEELWARFRSEHVSGLGRNRGAGDEIRRP